MVASMTVAEILTEALGGCGENAFTRQPGGLGRLGLEGGSQPESVSFLRM